MFPRHIVAWLKSTTGLDKHCCSMCLPGHFHPLHCCLPGQSRMGL
uniref:Uncharacterized protein n=1 Tax=Arundo donax TaxID=35708 RepID=A0A0A9CTK1_ARUDO